MEDPLYSISTIFTSIRTKEPPSSLTASAASFHVSGAIA